MENYNKSDFIADVVNEADAPRPEVEKVLRALFGVLAQRAKEGHKISWPGFGSFQASERAARKGRNPKSGAEIDIPASTVMKFTAAKALKDMLNERHDN